MTSTVCTRASICIFIATLFAVFGSTDAVAKDLGPSKYLLPRIEIMSGGKTYTGPFDPLNSDMHYLESLIFMIVPGLVIAIVLLFVMLVMLLVQLMACACRSCCKCWNGAYKPRPFTRRDMTVMKTFLALFCAATIAGCVLVYIGGPMVTGNVSNTVGGVQDQILILEGEIINIAGNLTTAATVLGSSNSVDPGTSLVNLKDAFTTVNDKVQEAKGYVDDIMSKAGMSFIIIAAVIAFISISGLVCGVFGHTKTLVLVLCFTCLALVISWIAWGVDTFTGVLISDMCSSMSDYIVDPSTSTLGDIIPCSAIEPAALDIMNVVTRPTIVLGINAINNLLPNLSPKTIFVPYSTTTVSAFCPSFQKGSLGSYEDFICGLSSLPSNTAIYPADVTIDTATEINVGDFDVTYADNKCDSDPITQACTNNNQYIDSTTYKTLSDQTNAVQGLINILPSVDDMLACKFVDDILGVFASPTDGTCGPLNDGLYLLWVGFLLISIAYLCMWITLMVAHSRHANPNLCKDNKINDTF